jgi:hypothetical protein
MTERVYLCKACNLPITGNDYSVKQFGTITAVNRGGWTYERPAYYRVHVTCPVCEGKAKTESESNE